VHINSGIPNRAFFLFASEVGRDIAEQVYYHALDNYLVRSSQFIDARIAVISAAEDLYDADVANAARDAFSAVGLGSGSGGNYEEVLDINPGDDFMLISDNDFNDLYFVNPGAGNIIPLDVPPPFSRPSISDDGSAAVYVDDNGFLKAILFDWSGTSLDYEVIDLEGTPQPVWRNIAISKDGGRIAFITEDLNNSLYVFDFVGQNGIEYELFNPTTGPGGPQTGGVDFADALEWDYTGERLMYDAQNTIPGTFGDDVEYWDIGFIDVWDNNSEDFGSGQIQKLFTSLPENVNIGNPSFAKNSVDIVVFDFVEVVGGIASYAILATNIETGRVELIFENDALGYPNYSVTDELIVFDTKDPNGNTPLLIGAIDVNPDDIMDSDESSARIFIEGARWGTWFATGTRDLLSDIDDPATRPVSIFPNPASSTISIMANGIDGEAMIEIYDAAGRIVLSSEMMLVNGQISRDIHGLQPGLYTLRLSAQNGIYVGRFMKN
jgi:hypothetical protein